MAENQGGNYNEVEFLEEVISEIIKLKIKKNINPNSNEFDTQLKLFLGKKRK